MTTPVYTYTISHTSGKYQIESTQDLQEQTAKVIAFFNLYVETCKEKNCSTETNQDEKFFRAQEAEGEAEMHIELFKNKLGITSITRV